jgi:hypothetical protein
MQADGGKGRLNFLYSNALEAGKFVYISLDVDRQHYHAKLRAFPRASYDFPFAVDAHCAFGPPAVYVTTSQGFLDAGAKTVILALAWPNVGQVRYSAQKVVPYLQ